MTPGRGSFPWLARGDISSVPVARRTFSAPCCLRALREQHSPRGQGSWRWLGLALAGPCSGAMAPGVWGCSGAGPCRASARWEGCTEADGGRAATGLTARTAAIWLIPCWTCGNRQWLFLLYQSDEWTQTWLFPTGYVAFSAEKTPEIK